MNAQWSDWILGIGAWALAGVGLLLLTKALIGDRSNGRRRCRRCWYDMSLIKPIEGTWTCPECAKTARIEKQMLRSKRSMRLAVVASLLMLLAHPTWLMPNALREGVASVLPTTLLLLVAPIEADDFSLQTQDFASFYDLDSDSHFTKELLERARARTLAPSQVQHLMDKILKAQPEFVWAPILARDSWPANQPVLVDPDELMINMPFVGPDVLFRFRVKPDGEWIEQLYADRYRPIYERAQSLGSFPPGTIAIEGELLQGIRKTQLKDRTIAVDYTNASPVWRADIATIEIGTPAEDLIETITSATFESQVGKKFYGIGTDREGDLWISITELWRPREFQHIDMGVGLRIDVFADDQAIATGSALMRMIRPGQRGGSFGGTRYTFPLRWTTGPVDLSAYDSVVVQAKSDPDTAIRDLTRTIFWHGESTSRVTNINGAYWKSEGFARFKARFTNR